MALEQTFFETENATLDGAFSGVLAIYSNNLGELNLSPLDKMYEKFSLGILLFFGSIL